MNYNNLRRKIRVIWGTIGILIFAAAFYVIIVIKEDLYCSRASTAVVIYFACDIAVRILLWWLDEKAGREKNRGDL